MRQNSNNRRAALWNVSQPGDPYDIRKSMIAKLPQHPSRFMGDNIQLVCLFQAAQIERLTQFLDQMALKVRQTERIQLDRHSYQVQIKQLVSKINQLGGFKRENEKLKQFISRQTEQMQSVRSSHNSSQNLIQLQTKYQGVLNQLRICRQNDMALKRTNNQFLKQITEWRFKYEQKQRAYNQYTSAQQQQFQIVVQKAAKDTKIITDSKQYQLKGEINVLKENLALKNRQIEIQKSKNTHLHTTLVQKQQQANRYLQGQAQVQQNKAQQFFKISKRLEQTSLYLQQTQKNNMNLKDEIFYLSKKIKQLQEDNRLKQIQLRTKKQYYNNNPDLLIQINEAQIKMASMETQVNRLRQVIQRRQRQIEDNQAQVNALKSQLISTHRNIQSLQKALANKVNQIKVNQRQTVLIRSKCTSYEQNIVHMERQLRDKQSIMRQNQRQTSFIKSKYSSYEKTLQSLKMQVRDKESVIKRLQSDSRLYEDKDSKIQTMARQINRLNKVLEDLFRQRTNLQVMASQYGATLNNHLTIIRSKQEAISIVQTRKRSLEIKAIELEETNRLNFDQINRLNLKIGNLENLNLQLKRQLDLSSQKTYQLSHLKARIQALSQQNNIKMVENQKLREDNQQMYKQINYLQQNLGNSQNNSKQERRILNQKLQQRTKQLQQKAKQLEQRNKQLQQKSKQSEQKSKQLQQKSKQLQQKTKQCRNIQKVLHQKQMLERENVQKITMYGNSMPQMSGQIERLQNLIQKRQGQINRLKQEVDRERRNSSDCSIKALTLEQTISSWETKARNQQRDNGQLLQQIARLKSQINGTQQRSRQKQHQLQRSLSTLKVREASLSDSERTLESQQHTINQLKQQVFNYLDQSEGSRRQLQDSLETIKKLQSHLDLSRRNADKYQADLQKLAEDYNRLGQQTFQINSIKSTNENLKQTTQNLKGQFQKLGSQKQQLNKQLNDLRSRNLTLEQILRNSNAKITEYQQNIRHVEQANLIKIQEFRVKLIQENGVKTRDSNDRYTQLLQKYRQLQGQNQQQFQRSQDRLHETQDVERENTQLRQSLSSHQQKLYSYEQKIALLSQEIQRLTQEKIQLKKQIEGLKRSQIDNQRVDRLNLQLEQAQTELTNLKRIVNEFESINEHAIAQRDELFEITHQQAQKIDTLKRQIVGFQQLERQYSYCHGQLDSLRKKYDSLYNQRSSMQSQYHDINRQLQTTKKQVLRQNQQTTNEYEMRIQRASEQHESLLRIQRQKTAQLIQGIQKQARALNIIQQKNNQLHEHIRQLQDQITQQQQLQGQMDQFKIQYTNIKLLNQELNRKLIQMQDQLVELGDHRNDRNGELNRVINQNNQLKALIQNQRQGLLILQRESSESHSQISRIKAQAQARIRSIEANLLIFQQQSSVIKQQNASLRVQISSLKQQLQNLEIEVSQTAVYKQISLQWQQKYKHLYQQYGNLYDSYNIMKTEYSNIEGISQSSQFRLQQLQHQFGNLNQLIIQLRNQNMNLNTQKMNLNTYYMNLNTQKINLNTQNMNLKAQNQSMRHQFNNYSVQLRKIIQRNQQLQRQKSKLYTLYQLNKDLNQQLSELRLRLSDEHALQNKIKENMLLFVLLCAEIDSLRTRVQQAQWECQQLKRHSLSP